MNVFKIYLLFNIGLIAVHVLLYVVTVMGLGSGSEDAPRSEVVNILVFMAILGASPNLLLFLISLLRRKQVKENALWAAVFTVLVLLGYLLVFWPFAVAYAV